MGTILVFALVAAILIFVVIYRNASGTNMYKYIADNTTFIYDKLAPYTYSSVREKIKDLGQDYTPHEYLTQAVGFAIGGAIISFLYFYSLIISIIYAAAAVAIIPYLNYLRCKRLYSEFIFEQIQVYTSNTIMEFATTQSFVKSLEGVYDSGVLEDPVKTDVKVMIDMAYENGTIDQSLSFMKYAPIILANN